MGRGHMGGIDDFWPFDWADEVCENSSPGHAIHANLSAGWKGGEGKAAIKDEGDAKPIRTCSNGKGQWTTVRLPTPHFRLPTSYYPPRPPNYPS